MFITSFMIGINAKCTLKYDVIKVFAQSSAQEKANGRWIYLPDIIFLLFIYSLLDTIFSEWNILTDLTWMIQIKASEYQ